MVNLLSLTSLLTFDTCSLLSPDGELAVPDFFAHPPNFLLTFDTCSLFLPDAELAVPDFFATLCCMFAPLT